MNKGMRFGIFAGVVLMIASAVQAQKVVGTVKIVRDKLQGRNLDLFEGLEQKITNYINNTDWSKTDDPTPLNLDIQLFLEKVSETGESRLVTASLYISNGKELQFLDKECKFIIKKGSTYYYDVNRIDSFLSLLDFYIFIMLGDEFDTLGKMAGTPFFQRAKNIALQAKALIGENVAGWESRQIKIDDMLDPRYGEYRIMKDFFYEGLSNYNNGEIKTARANFKKAIDILEAIITKNITAYHSERFLQLHYLDICRVFESSGESMIFDRLIALDRQNKDTYLKYRDQR